MRRLALCQPSPGLDLPLELVDRSDLGPAAGELDGAARAAGRLRASSLRR